MGIVSLPLPLSWEVLLTYICGANSEKQREHLQYSLAEKLDLTWLRRPIRPNQERW